MKKDQSIYKKFNKINLGKKERLIYLSLQELFRLENKTAMQLSCKDLSILTGITSKTSIIEALNALLKGDLINRVRGNGTSYIFSLTNLTDENDPNPDEGPENDPGSGPSSGPKDGPTPTQSPGDGPSYCLEVDPYYQNVNFYGSKVGLLTKDDFEPKSFNTLDVSLRQEEPVPKTQKIEPIPKNVNFEGPKKAKRPKNEPALYNDNMSNTPHDLHYSKQVLCSFELSKIKKYCLVGEEMKEFRSRHAVYNFLVRTPESINWEQIDERLEKWEQVKKQKAQKKVWVESQTVKFEDSENQVTSEQFRGHMQEAKVALGR